MRGAVLTALGCLAATCCSSQPFSPFRYDDDRSAYLNDSPKTPSYQRLKYWPLDDDQDSYLLWGADLRERVESSNVALLGFRYRNDDTYDLHRFLLYADLHVDGFRAFAQLGNELETGRKPGPVPTDVDHGDLAQGFVDYRIELADAPLTFRLGRFEMSFDEGALIGLRDGPNVRQTWDGGWTFYKLPTGQVDIFAVKPVNVNPGWFDDNHVAGQSLWGVHLELAPPRWAPVVLNAFYYGNTMPKVLFSSVAGEEHTNTLGARLHADVGAFDGSLGGIGQTGSFGDRNVRAWSAHGDAGWTFGALPWRPRLGFRADVLSGGDDLRGTVHTFNALYPNYAFSTEATIEAPANLIQSGATLDVRPMAPVTVQYKVEGLWRYSLEDAFYAAPTFALVKPSTASTQRYSGTEQQLRASWQINPLLSVAAAYVHYDPSAFLRSAHALNENFGVAEVSLRL